MKRGNKGHGQFVITGGNPAKNFQFIEEALHQMPLLVGMKVARPGVSAILLGWYRINRVLPGNVITNSLRAAGCKCQ